jgi:dolichyl-phosphate beta-glucosyltransferase
MNERGVPGISIIIPAFNEELRIGATLRDYLGYFCENHNSDFEIITVLNGCSDNTRGVVLHIADGSPEIRMLEFEKPLGKGGAIWHGFNAARGRVIVFVDADNMVGPSQADLLLDSLDSYHVAIADRFSRAHSGSGQSLGRKFISTFGRVWIRMVLGLHHSDTQCGAKAFRANAWRLIGPHIQEKGWAFDLDVLNHVKLLALRVDEVPVYWRHVPQGSKVRMITAVPEVLIASLRIRYRTR